MEYEVGGWALWENMFGAQRARLWWELTCWSLQARLKLRGDAWPASNKAGFCWTNQARAEVELTTGSGGWSRQQGVCLHSMSTSRLGCLACLELGTIQKRPLSSVPSCILGLTPKRCVSLPRCSDSRTCAALSVTAVLAGSMGPAYKLMQSTQQQSIKC